VLPVNTALKSAVDQANCGGNSMSRLGFHSDSALKGQPKTGESKPGRLSDKSRLNNFSKYGGNALNLACLNRGTQCRALQSLCSEVGRSNRLGGLPCALQCRDCSLSIGAILL
jgi:hypothetical protein